MIDVDRRLGLGEQHAFAAPVLQKLRGPRVAVVGVVVARLVAVEDQADDVGRMLLVELRPAARADHVVGRSDHVAQRADVAQVVTKSAKGLNFGHGGQALGVRDQGLRKPGNAPAKQAPSNKNKASVVIPKPCRLSNG